MDEVVETETEGFFSRLMSSIAGIFVGILLVLAGFPVLWCNEGNSVATWNALQEGRGLAVAVDAASAAAANEGGLVQITGKAVGEGVVSDPMFGVKVEGAVGLKRQVEMYQWKENSETKTTKSAGGKQKKVTTYSYEMVWADDLINSSSFNTAAGHENPGSMPFEGESWTAPKVTVGGFTLSSALAGQVSNWQTLSVDQETYDSLAPGLKQQLALSGGGLYRPASVAQMPPPANPAVPADPANPAAVPAVVVPGTPMIGDTRITFKANESADVSVLGKQTGPTLGAYQTSNGKDISDLRMGTMTVDEMFSAAETESVILTWILRAVGFGMMWVGLFLIGRPVVVVADILPFLGSLAALAVGGVAFLGAAMCTLPTIAVAWIFYRPLLGIALLVVGFIFMAAVAGLVFTAFGMYRKRAAGGEEAAA